MKKSSGFIGEKHIYSSYAYGEFDFLIAEIGGTRFSEDDTIIKEPDKYLNNFMIIPAAVLKERGFLNENGIGGKVDVCICPPDYKNSHWTKQYWNNFDVLR